MPLTCSPGGWDAVWDMKECNVCHETKPLDEFHNDRRRPDGKVAMCKSCRKEYRRKWYEENRDEAIAYSTKWKRENRDRINDYQRKFKYGIPYGTYERMLEEQDGGCAICHKPPPEGKSLHVDHCHSTLSVRGLLCDTCNRGIGYFHEDTDKMRAAIAYLEDWSSS